MHNQEKIQDALCGKPRSDGSRLRSFGVRTVFKDGEWQTVYVLAYDNDTTVEVVRDKKGIR